MEALHKMSEQFPDAQGELDARNPFELLIAVILSAQTTDIAVNKVTPALFEEYPTPEALASGDLNDIMDKLRTIGLYRNKAKNIKAAARMLLDDFDGVVPKTHKELERLPGVGRKTANVVLGDAFGIPGIAVDTHVERVSKRLRIAKQSSNVVEVEEALMRKIPKELWVQAHHTMILFGRYHCVARKPKCAGCPLLYLCGEGQKLMKERKE